MGQDRLTSASLETTTLSPASARRASGALCRGSVPDRLRVCLLGEGTYPEVVGGMELHTYHLAERLLDLGVACEVLARPVRPETPRVQQVGRITIRHLGFGGQLKGKGTAAALPLAGFVARYGAWLIKERRRFDLVLALGTKTTAVPGLLANLATRLPLVVLSGASAEFAEPITAASLASNAALHRLIVPWQRFRRLMLGRASAIIAVSEEVAAGFRSLGVPPERVAYIPNGVDTNRFRPADPDERAALRARLGLPLERTVFAFVGRLSRAKGLPMLARLWPGVVARHPDAHLLLIGSGRDSFDDCEAEVRQIAAEAGVADRLTITGRTDDAASWLRAADAFLFPSDHEGFGIALLEAMAAGLPIVTTAVGAAPQLVADPAHGRIVPPGDADAFAAAVEELYTRRPDWPAMGAAARAVTTAGYSLDVVAARYARLLRAVATARQATQSRPYQPARS